MRSLVIVFILIAVLSSCKKRSDDVVNRYTPYKDTVKCAYNGNDTLTFVIERWNNDTIDFWGTYEGEYVCKEDLDRYETINKMLGIIEEE